MKKYYCLDCKKEISRNGMRCKNCCGKLRFRLGKKIKKKGKNNLNLDTIKKLYCEDMLSAIKIGKLLGCSQNTILRRLKVIGIKIRMSVERPNWVYKKYYCVDCGKEVTYKYSKRCRKCADKNSRKKQGVSSDFYHRIAKENLLQECSKCGTKKNICVHHKDGNSRNNELSNLIILCRSCHAKKHNLKNNLNWDYARLSAEKRKIIQDIKKIPNQELSDKVKKVVINKIREIK